MIVVIASSVNLAFVFRGPGALLIEIAQIVSDVSAVNAYPKNRSVFGIQIASLGRFVQVVFVRNNRPSVEATEIVVSVSSVAIVNVYQAVARVVAVLMDKFVRMARVAQMWSVR